MVGSRHLVKIEQQSEKQKYSLAAHWRRVTPIDQSRRSLDIQAAGVSTFKLDLSMSSRSRNHPMPPSSSLSFRNNNNNTMVIEKGPNVNKSVSNRAGSRTMRIPIVNGGSIIPVVNKVTKKNYDLNNFHNRVIMPQRRFLQDNTSYANKRRIPLKKGPLWPNESLDNKNPVNTKKNSNFLNRLYGINPNQTKTKLPDVRSTPKKIIMTMNKNYAIHQKSLENIDKNVRKRAENSTIRVGGLKDLVKAKDTVWGLDGHVIQGGTVQAVQEGEPEFLRLAPEHYQEAFMRDPAAHLYGSGF